MSVMVVCASISFHHASIYASLRQYEACMVKKKDLGLKLTEYSFQALQDASDLLKIPKSEIIERLIQDYLQPMKDRISERLGINK